MSGRTHKNDYSNTDGAGSRAEVCCGGGKHAEMSPQNPKKSPRKEFSISCLSM